MLNLQEVARSRGPILSEADHRIANNLALIAAIVRRRGRACATLGSSPVCPLSEIAVRIEAVGQLHRSLAVSSQSDAMPLAPYLSDVCRLTTKAMAESDAIALDVDIAADVTLPASQAATVGLIVTEALTNSLKYAHPAGVPGTVRVCGRRGEGRLVLSVEDDGVGLPEDTEIGAHSGFKVMKALAAGLGGTLNWATGPLGLTVTLVIP